MSLFTAVAAYNYQPIIISGGGPPSFYTSSFGSAVMVPFFAINDGGYNTVTDKWQQWGSISGSLPLNIGAFSMAASGSGTITYDNTTKGYIFNNKYIYYTGSVNTGSWIASNTSRGQVNWNEQQIGLFWQGVIPVGAELATNYIASAGNTSLTQYYGWDLTWNTGSVVWIGGSNTNNVAGSRKKFFSGSFVPGTKYNVMFTLGYGSATALRYGNMFYAKVNADGTSEPVTQSANGPYNFGSSDGYNSAVYFYDAANGNTTAKFGKGTLSAGAAGLINSASLHSFMMYSYTPYSSIAVASLISFAGTQNSASAGATSYIQQIFNSSSLTWVTT